MASTFGTPGSGPGLDLLVRNWWAVALRGVFAILFGLAAIFFTPATIGALVLVFGIYMLIDGVFAIVSGVRAAERHERWGLFILEGLVDLLAGLAAVFMPGLTLIVLIYVMGGWAIVTGVLMAAAAFRAVHGKGWLIAAGVISVIWGILLFIAPIAGALVLTWFIGGYALFFGIALLILAFRLRRGRTSPA
jgi:uncharacterized membrane protein HdeD (DUF308 family)